MVTLGRYNKRIVPPQACSCFGFSAADPFSWHVFRCSPLKIYFHRKGVGTKSGGCPGTPWARQRVSMDATAAPVPPVRPPRWASIDVKRARPKTLLTNSVDIGSLGREKRGMFHSKSGPLLTQNSLPLSPHLLLVGDIRGGILSVSVATPPRFRRSAFFPKSAAVWNGRGGAWNCR